jgi:REP element-mobilizing transposase RayT
MPRTRYKILEGAEPHFLTCSIVAALPLFAQLPCAEAVLDAWRFLTERNRLALFGYVIMENHLHFIASAADLRKELKAFKTYTARRMVEELEAAGALPLLRLLEHHKAASKSESQHQVWQEGSHPQLIQGEDMFRQKLNYIHENPVRRGYVDEAVHWRYSSARDYAGMPGLIPVVTDW